MGLIVLLFGVTMFSFIMGQFMDIIMYLNSFKDSGNHKDLTKWISLLARYNNGNPLEKSMITEIESFFDYYWDFNRLEALKSEDDLLFLDQLPQYVQD